MFCSKRGRCTRADRSKQTAEVRLLPSPIMVNILEMARAAKRPTTKPLTGLFGGTLTAQFYL